MSTPLVNTLVVCLGTSVLAASLGLTLAILTSCFRVPAHRWMSAIMLSLVFIPVYVQATAWSAGFGVTGWFRWSQVAAALSPTTAIASVVWIQSMALAPVCFLLCRLGVRRAFDANTRQALLDFGPWYALTHVLLPKLGPWIACAVLWSVAMTGNDMVVTNLFQVPTLTERVYQQVQFNELDWSIIALACSFSVGVGLVAWFLMWQLHRRVGSETFPTSSLENCEAFRLQGTRRWIGSIVGWTVVWLVALIPLGNLIIKAGWVATMENDQPRREWSLWVLSQSVWQTGTYVREISWSLQLALYSTLMAFAIGVGLLLCCRSRSLSWLVIGLMACLLSTPGPLVNLFVIWLFDRREPEWIGWLADRTLIGPILAQQSRCLPLVFGILWLARDRYERRNDRLIRLDLHLPWWTRASVLCQAIGSPIAIAIAVSFFVSIADLSSYLLVQPPQVTTVAMRMFDLLHYGIKNRESGLALVLVMASLVPTLLWLRKSDGQNWT